MIKKREMLAEQLFEEQEKARQSKRFDHALDILDTMHRDYHDHAAIHVRVHIESAKTNAALKNYRQVAFHLFVIIFAPPASWFQRYLGLVRKDI